MTRAISEANKTPLGNRVRLLREAAGITEKDELSRAAGASKAVCYQIEEGIVEQPSMRVIVGFAKALGTTVEYLATGEGTPPTPEQTRAAYERALAETDAARNAGTEG